MAPKSHALLDILDVSHSIELEAYEAFETSVSCTSRLPLWQCQVFLFAGNMLIVLLLIWLIGLC